MSESAGDGYVEYLMSLDQHPAPWWFRLAQRWFPGRCREIPEANNPGRTVLRQVALLPRGRHAIYLQQFASAEDPQWMHSHQFHWMLAVGLWGAYTERRLAGPSKRRQAPYCYVLDASTIHHVQRVTPGHTSLFFALWRDDKNKYYYPTPAVDRREGAAHIKVKVGLV